VLKLPAPVQPPVGALANTCHGAIVAAMSQAADSAAAMFRTMSFT
jgi:hypothetical protein